MCHWLEKNQKIPVSLKENVCNFFEDLKKFKFFWGEQVRKGGEVQFIKKLI